MAGSSAAAKRGLVTTKGDQTLRTKVFDLARGVDWPWHYSGRVVENSFARRWHGDIEGLKEVAEAERARYEGTDPDDLETRVLIVGEALDLIEGIKPAAEIVHGIVDQAAGLLRRSDSFLS